MIKIQQRKQAIEEVIKLMKELSEYMDSVKDKPFTEDIRTVLKSKGDIIRWLQKGIESGYYEE